MLGSSPLVGFLATTDLARAGEFYSSTLGLESRGNSPIARIFDANGTALRVALVDRFSPADHTVLGWTDVSLTQLGTRA